MLKWPHPKDPNSDLDYIVDWTDWLQGDTIASSSWVVPDDVTTTGNSFNDNVTTIWLSAGIDATNYTLVNTIHTASGRIAERNVQLKVKDK